MGDCAGDDGGLVARGDEDGDRGSARTGEGRRDVEAQIDVEERGGDRGAEKREGEDGGDHAPAALRQRWRRVKLAGLRVID